jgi:hypothetical protein
MKDRSHEAKGRLHSVVDYRRGFAHPSDFVWSELNDLPDSDNSDNTSITD